MSRILVQTSRYYVSAFRTNQNKLKHRQEKIRLFKVDASQQLELTSEQIAECHLSADEVALVNGHIKLASQNLPFDLVWPTAHKLLLAMQEAVKEFPTHDKKAKLTQDTFQKIRNLWLEELHPIIKSYDRAVKTTAKASGDAAETLTDDAALDAELAAAWESRQAATMNVEKNEKPPVKSAPKASGYIPDAKVAGEV